jgi:hypothetical protein
MGYLNAINSAADGSSSASIDHGTGLGDAIQSLASSAGVDSSKLSNIVDKLKAGLDSGNSSQVGQSINDLIDLLKGTDSTGSSGSGGSDSSSGSSGSSDDLLSKLGKMLEAMGLSKDQIDKIINKAQEAGVSGATFNADNTGANDVSGVKAA